MADVFISYSRKDKDFVRALHEALLKQNRDTWVDWEDIPPIADWWQEIQAGIEAADTFVFVVSPASISSKVCREEIDYAVACHKRLVPIVYREGFDGQSVHPALAKYNWLFFREQDDFEQAFQLLLNAIDTDLEYVRQHTRILVRAIEWKTQNRNRDLLLRGTELARVLQQAVEIGDKEPQPTTLQREFVMGSLEFENARQAEELRRRRRTTMGIAAFSVASLAVAFFQFQQHQIAEQQRQIAEQQSQIAAEQSRIAFARQLATQAQTRVRQGNLLQQETTKDASEELALRVGTAALPANVLPLLKGIDVMMIEFTPDRRHVAVVNQKTDLRVWDVATSKLIYNKNQRQAISIKFSPNSQLLTAAERGGTLKIWQITDNNQLTLLKTLKGHTNDLIAIAFSPAGKYLATSSLDRTVKVWHPDGTLLYTLPHPSTVRAVAFSPNEEIIATASDDRIARIWKSETGEEIACFLHEEPVKLVAFSQNGHYLGTVSGDTVVHVLPQQAIAQNNRNTCR